MSASSPLRRRAALIIAAGTLLVALRIGAAHGLRVLPAFAIQGVGLDDLITYLLLPAAVLRLLGEHPLGYFSLGRLRAIRVALPLAVVGVAASGYALARVAAVRQHYAAVRPSPAYALHSLLTLACVEFFFRGFLVQVPYRAVGWPALLLATLPYAAIHVGMPAVELYGSIAFGLALAYLAAESGSVCYGLALHWLLATGAVAWIAAAG